MKECIENLELKPSNDRLYCSCTSQKRKDNDITTTNMKPYVIIHSTEWKTESSVQALICSKILSNNVMKE